MPKLTLVRGLPGSGKSTYARSLGCLHLEQDMALVKDGIYHWSKESIRGAVAFCQTMAVQAMSWKVDIVVSNTFTRLFEILPYFQFAKEHGYDVVVVHVLGDFGSAHSVPEGTMKAMRDRWEAFPCDLIVDNRKAQDDAP